MFWRRRQSLLAHHSATFLQTRGGMSVVLCSILLATTAAAAAVPARREDGGLVLLQRAVEALDGDMTLIVPPAAAKQAEIMDSMTKKAKDLDFQLEEKAKAHSAHIAEMVGDFDKRLKTEEGVISELLSSNGKLSAEIAIEQRRNAEFRKTLNATQAKVKQVAVDMKAVGANLSASGSQLDRRLSEDAEAVLTSIQSVSTTEVAVDPQPQLVTFTVREKTAWGDVVKIVGSSAQLGAWDVAKGIALTTDEGKYPDWSTSMLVNFEPNLEYKFVQVHTNGDVTWESFDGNRQLLPGTNEVKAAFGQVSLMQAAAPRQAEPRQAPVVTFRVRENSSWGDVVKIVGSSAQLGAWDVAKGLDLSTDESTYPFWTASVQVAFEPNLEYKFVLVSPEGAVVWEPFDGNRQLAPGTTTVNAVFGQMSLLQAPAVQPPPVTFRVRENSSWGDVVKIVGSSAQLGAWDVAKGLDLSTDESTYPFWTASVQVAFEPNLEYKFVLVSPEGAVVWEPFDGNRQLAPGTTTVNAVFGQMSLLQGARNVIPDADVDNLKNSLSDVQSQLDGELVDTFNKQYHALKAREEALQVKRDILNKSLAQEHNIGAVLEADIKRLQQLLLELSDKDTSLKSFAESVDAQVTHARLMSLKDIFGSNFNKTQNASKAATTSSHAPTNSSAHKASPASAAADKGFFGRAKAALSAASQRFAAILGGATAVAPVAERRGNVSQKTVSAAAEADIASPEHKQEPAQKKEEVKAAPKTNGSSSPAASTSAAANVSSSSALQATNTTTGTGSAEEAAARAARMDAAATKAIAALRSLAMAKSVTFAQLLGEFDSDSNQVLSQVEFRKAMSGEITGQKEMNAKLASRIFARLDVSPRDGHLDASEMSPILSKRSPANATATAGTK
eukprot:TRINITY_DN2785_c0_g1_i1.p1 TRINITY_DN2785_c0_g1~~TRINITY_DN2785_c0_g1_i1.p1  ORF type:complete len:897 (-),score=226.43 TRINITY_DN2785_c0_g1_i1:217-2907(-)